MLPPPDLYSVDAINPHQMIMLCRCRLHYASINLPKSLPMTSIAAATMLVLLLAGGYHWIIVRIVDCVVLIM